MARGVNLVLNALCVFWPPPWCCWCYTFPKIGFWIKYWKNH